MRCPAVAGRFYPAHEDSLVSEIEDCFTHPLGPGFPGKEGSARSIVSAVAPHAGYRASGMNAAHTYKAIKEDGLPDAYVIIGPDHYGIPHRAALCSDPYLTPLGECKTHDDICKRLSKLIPDDPSAHTFEHSVEVQIPFIQYIDEDPHIVPIIMRDQSLNAAKDLASAVKEACEGFDVIVIASSDLSHYIPKRVATKVDMEFMDEALNMDADGMYRTLNKNNMSVCGYGPIATSIIATNPSSSRLLSYTDSFDSLGGRDEVVGYASAVFFR